MKKRIKIISTSIALFSIGVSLATSISLINDNVLNAKSTSITNTSNTKNDNSNDLVPAQANGQNANISTNAGPVTFNNNVITALDWYGNKLWQIDMGEKVPLTNGASQYQGSFKRAWFNWDYNRETNILWVLGYGYFSNQSIFGIDASTGTILKTKDLGYVGNGVDKNYQTPYKFVTALSSGKVLIYGGATTGYDASGALYDPSDGSVTKIKGNSDTNLPYDQETHNRNTYRWYFYNLIPLANGINLAEVVTFDSKQTGTKDDESAKNASYNVYGILVDDNLNFIGDSQVAGSDFSKPYKLADGMVNFRNTTITPQRDYFTLLNSQTASVTYNTVTLFNTSNLNNIKVAKVKMTDSKWIQTWTIDSNDNLYFKFLDDGKVYKIDGDTLKSGSNDFSPTTYLDLSSVTSNQSVRDDAKNFLIYNVYGYTGQLMMIDASYYNQINIYDKQNQLDSNKNWGLAIAVVPNKNDNKAGDFKGVLNGPDSIQKAADFTIEESVLKTKIPSEISKSDIKLLNDAFFKSDDTKPFIITDINDETGTFTITANLYKIPWFADTLPANSVPKVVTYTFNGTDSNKSKAQTISSKVSWKTLNTSTDYDFMNMKPSNVKVEDLNNLNPFQVSFQSQTIYDSSGKQIYPQTTYSIGDVDDKNGTIKVNVTYKYVPMSVTYTDGQDKRYSFGGKEYVEKQVLTYTTSNTYTIFKQSDSSAFYFMGASQSSDGTEQTINVANVPQLKSLMSAGTLPSSFTNLNNSNDSSNSAFLQFINTSLSKGYPISKMNFSVSANDNEGTLSISATMPSEYSPDGKEHTYKVKYTGLNKQSSYKFSFNDSVTQINNVSILNILPSAVDEGEIIKNFITYQGFDSNDFNVVLTPNDEKGRLTIQVNLIGNYASSIANENGFNNYSISKTYEGFMTTSQYNNRFSLTFKGDDDTSLLNLKSMQANEIITAFGSDGKSGNNKGLTVGDVTYNSLNEFVEKLLVSSKGSSIPNDWSKNDSGVTTNVYVDNSLGIASFYVNIKQSSVPGATSDLNFVVTYSGFVKGNEVQTDDNLSFVSNTMLKNYLVSIKAFDETTIKQLTPDSFASWAKDNIDKLITYKTGEYTTKLESKKYTLTITPNDLQDTVTITINFGEMQNKNSLSEYSIQYTI